jgi:hypothetical protein
VADQRSGVDTGELFFTHGEGNNRDVFSGNTCRHSRQQQRRKGT